MPTPTRNLNPVAGALLGGTLATFVLPLLALGGVLTVLLVPLFAVWGATRFGRPFAPLAVALMGGFLVGRLVSLLVFPALSGQAGIAVFTVATLGTAWAIWLADVELRMQIGNGLVSLPSRRGRR